MTATPNGGMSITGCGVCGGSGVIGLCQHCGGSGVVDVSKNYHIRVRYLSGRGAAREVDEARARCVRRKAWRCDLDPRLNQEHPLDLMCGSGAMVTSRPRPVTLVTTS